MKKSPHENKKTPPLPPCFLSHTCLPSPAPPSGVYYGVCLIVLTFNIAFSVYVLNLSQQGDRGHPVPGWWRSVARPSSPSSSSSPPSSSSHFIPVCFPLFISTSNTIQGIFVVFCVWVGSLLTCFTKTCPLTSIIYALPLC